jgi:hypothetical protein
MKDNVMKVDVNLPKTNSELLNFIIDEVYIYENKVTITLKRDLHVLVSGDFEITTNGELSVLSKGNIALDGKEVHLRSFNSKQIREMKEELLQELYKEIGKPQDPKEVEASRQQFMLEFKNQIKADILKELRS